MWESYVIQRLYFKKQLATNLVTYSNHQGKTEEDIQMYYIVINSLHAAQSKRIEQSRLSGGMPCGAGRWTPPLWEFSRDFPRLPYAPTLKPSR